MSHVDFAINEGDHLPEFETTLQNVSAAGVATAVDLTTAVSVAFSLRSLRDESFKILDAPAVFVDKPNGKVKYSWVEGNTDTPGIWLALFRVLWPTGKWQRFPNHGYLVVGVQEAIATQALDLEALIVADAPLAWWKAGTTDGASSNPDQTGGGRTMFLAGSPLPLLNQESLIPVPGSRAMRVGPASGSFARISHDALYHTAPFTLEFVGALDRLPTTNAQVAPGFIKSQSDFSLTSYSLSVAFGAPLPDAPFFTVFQSPAGTKKTVTAATALVIGQRFHVAGTFTTGNVLELFLDGVSQGTQTLDGGQVIMPTNGFLHIMGGVGTERLTGRASPWAFYSSILSPARILLHAQAALFGRVT